LLWCPEQSRRNSVASLLSLESLPTVRDLLAPRAPPKVAGPPLAMPEAVAPPAAAITEAPPAARPKPAAQYRLINVKSQRPSSELAEGGIPRRIVREVPKEVLPQALLSDAVAVRASPKQRS
jgi:hypothetical protein